VLKHCPRCGLDKELSEDNFYPARARKNHPKAGWQSFCRICWKIVNAEQRLKKKGDIGKLYLNSELEEAEEEVERIGGVLYEIVDGQLIERKRINVN
jgi:hypothetical protein